MREIRGVNQNVDTKFGSLQQHVASLQKEISQLRLDMITKVEFDALSASVVKIDERVQSLESGSVGGNGNSK